MLEIHSLSVSYGLRMALDNVSFSVHPGEIVAVIGPNGAGKSTLIRAVSGVQPLHAGQVCMSGRALVHLSTVERARCLAVVPQAHSLPAAFTVYEAVLLGRTPYLGWMGRAGQSDHAAVQRALQRTQTLSLAERLVGELSGGEQQRVLLARALAQETPALLFDEPTTYLDLQHQSGLLNLVRSLADEQKLAVLVVLHDLNLAGLYADRLALLVDGRLQALGTPEEVLNAADLTRVYKVPVHVIPHPDYGCPLVLPDGRMGARL